jgi:hypothetical protein
VASFYEASLKTFDLIGCTECPCFVEQGFFRSLKGMQAMPGYEAVNPTELS